jgi:hypothetical protein
MLGGFIGSFLAIGILYLIHFRHAGKAVYWGALALTRALPLTVVCATLIGALVWSGTRMIRTRKLPGALLGAIAAAIIASICGAFIDANFIDPDDGSLPWFFAWYGLIAGAVTGLVSGAHDHRSPDEG